MRRQPIVLRALIAVAMTWLAVSVSPRETPAASGLTVGSVHGDIVAVSSPLAAIGGAANFRKATPPNWPSHAFLPSRGLPVSSGAIAAQPAFHLSGIRGRASRTITYDATAPPAIPNTVR